MNASAQQRIESFEVVPTGGPLGAEVEGVDLRHRLEADAVGRLREALLEHCVLIFRNQQISDEQQVRFTRYFGTPVEHVRKQRARRVKEIFFISNVSEDGVPIGALGNDEVGFHSDLSYLKQPGTISMLYAVEVPETGGDTHWANCYAAYEALDEETRQRLHSLRAVHRHYEENQNPPEPVDHPVVRTHPETGRRCLYVGPHLTKSLVGRGDSEGRALLERLFDHVARPEFVWKHHWRVGDLVMWDNRCTLHRRDPFPDTERRILKRTQIFGDEVPTK